MCAAVMCFNSLLGSLKGQVGLWGGEGGGDEIHACRDGLGNGFYKNT